MRLVPPALDNWSLSRTRLLISELINYNSLKQKARTGKINCFGNVFGLIFFFVAGTCSPAILQGRLLSSLNRVYIKFISSLYDHIIINLIY